MGDFNINAQDQPDTLTQIFQNYQQIVQEPTHLEEPLWTIFTSEQTLWKHMILTDL